MFLLEFWGVDPAQKLAKYKTWLCVLIQLTVTHTTVQALPLRPEYIPVSVAESE